MAFVSLPTATVFWDLLDGTGNRAQVRAHVPAASLAATVLANLAGTATVMQAITGCTIEAFGVSYAQKDPVAAAPAADSRVENKGTFVFTAANGLRTRLEVPGILEAVLTSSGAVDLTDLAAIAFIDQILGGLYSSNTGSDITAISAAYQKFRRSTKAMLPSDRNVA